DGAAALEYLRAQGKYKNRRMPGLILLDLRLPKVDGHEVLGAIKQDPELRKTPVVVLTTSAAESDKARAYFNYANSYVVNPVDCESFHHMPRDLTFYWSAGTPTPRAS